MTSITAIRFIDIAIGLTIHCDLEHGPDDDQQDRDDWAVDDFRRYKYKAMQKWYLDIGDMLAFVNDVLTPHGFDEIVKDDFGGLRQMLARRLMD